MSEAMIKGICAAGLVAPEQIQVSNRQQSARLEELHQRYGVQVSQDKLADIASADCIILAVKPYMLADALCEIRSAISARQLIISVVAGVATQTLEESFSEPVAVIRAMPNTSSFVQESATALSRGSRVDTAQVQFTHQLFSVIGTAVEVEEQLLDAVTALSGSGPAYFYYIVEAMLKAGAELGLSEEISRGLLAQTLLGTAKMLYETGEDPAVLRRKVTSPNGTTMAAIAVLDQANVAEHFQQAVIQGAQRSAEMGREMRAQADTLACKPAPRF